MTAKLLNSVELESAGTTEAEVYETARIRRVPCRIVNGALFTKPDELEAWKASMLSCARQPLDARS
jgi:hypothetical protein